jgi:eukaryotic-like serine/threonine-protein kinase
VSNPEPDHASEIADAISRGEKIDWRRFAQDQSLSEKEIQAFQTLERISRIHAGDQPLLPQRSQRFEVLEELGHGHHGRVVRARDRLLGREVALKVLRRAAMGPERSSERFVREARVLASLEHPNVIHVHDVDEDEREVRIVLEYVRGRTLEQVVAKDGRLAPGEAAAIGIDLCRALAALHAKGLVHQDLKPANVMRAEGGRIVLLDFGFTRSAEASAAEGAGGTPLAMAPEQFQQNATVGPRADLYGLGTVLFYLTTGRYPAQAETFLEVRERVLSGRLTPLTDARPDIPASFASIVSRALAREAADRFESAGAFEAALREFLEGPDARRRSDRGARPWILAGTGVLGIALASVALVFALRGPPASLEIQMFRLRGDEEVPIAPGGSVRIGDQLSLELQSSRGVYVYVVNDDDSGMPIRCFPLPGLDLGNPLPGRERLRLPGRADGQRNYWTITPGGQGRETFLLVASPEPLPDVEKVLETLRVPARAGAGKVEEAERTALLEGLTRGAGGVEPAKVGAAISTGRLADVVAAPRQDVGSPDWPRRWWITLRSESR